MGSIRTYRRGAAQTVASVLEWPNPHFRGRNDDLVEAGGELDHLGVEAIESVIGVGIAGIALIDAAQEPAYLRAAAGPFDEGRNASGPGEIAAVIAVMNHQRGRQ